MPDRILIADNYPNVAALVRHWLALPRREIEIAHNESETLRLAEEFRPQLILMDIDIPAINGIALAKKIRDQGWGKQMIILALTGWPPETALAGNEAAFNGLLPRPIDYDHLAEFLTAFFPRDQAQTR